MEILLEIPIYKTEILMYFGAKKGLLKTVKRHSGKSLAKDIKSLIEKAPLAVGHTFMTTGGGLVVYLPFIPNDAERIATLVHELSHATNSILRDAGIQHTEETEEAYAYLLDYITEQTLKRLKEKTIQ